MTFFTSTAAICFILCHGAPADHMATFSEKLSKEKTIYVYATGAALKKFQERKVFVKRPFFLDNLSETEENVLAGQIARECSSAEAVITDVGHPFDIKLQKALAEYAGNTPRLAYYDNPEPYVPGGYSTTAAEVMLNSQGVLFANSKFAMETIYRNTNEEVNLEKQKRIGIGYYPVSQSEQVTERRQVEHQTIRADFLKKNGLVEQDPKILVYFGGNNEEYFERAFPAFLSFLTETIKTTDFSKLAIVIQQHPGAKERNLDGNQVVAWAKEQISEKAPAMIISDFLSEDAQVLADAALYYQTSMAPQFILEGIPTIQIGHEIYLDMLVKNDLALSVTNAAELAGAIVGLDDQTKQKPSRELIYSGLGIREDWFEVFSSAIMDQEKTKEKK
jgi:hypothetical protein